MSAPRFVNTSDGTCWTRREESRGGEALYAPEKCGVCPEFVMATYAELEAHGVVGTADVLPVPVGSEPQALSAEQLAEIRASVRGVVRLAPRAWMTLTAALLADYDRLLEERRSTNEALDDAVRELRARPSCPCPPEGRPHQVGCPQAEVPASERPVNGLTSTFAPVAALREVADGEHWSMVHHDYKGPGRDFPELGGV